MSAGTPASGAIFAIRTLAIAIAVAVVGFASFLVLSAYAPDFRPTRNGGAHALSTSAVGFTAIAEIVRMTRGEVGLIRRDQELGDDGLLVLTPSAETDPAEIEQILARREGLPTLIVLPKWAVKPLPGKPGWVRAMGKLPPFLAIAPLAGIATPHFAEAPGGLRMINDATLDPIVKAPGGGAWIAAIPDQEVYLLSDPDLIDNHGLATRSGAERAMALLDRARTSGTRIAFDLTLAGFGQNPNLLKLAFEPPFLPLTLCLFLAALMAGWHAARRFGAPDHEQRAVAFGKRAIAENGAALLRLAKRRHRTGARYAALTRDAVIAAAGVPASLNGDALDAYLDRLDPNGEPFSSIAARAADAPDTRRLLAAARDLHHWKRTVTRER